MTIAISLKVHDGLVLASDSATTLIGTNPNGQQQVMNVYNSANKIFNLRKGLPIAGMTWGSGSIGAASISTIAKDLRVRFTDSKHAWHLDPQNYELEEVAKRAREFLFEELYAPNYAQSPVKPSLGFLVAGYSSNQGLAEEWLISIDGGNCLPPQLLKPKEVTGINWFGEPEAITRLILGHGTNLTGVMQKLGVPDAQIQPALAAINQELQVQFVQAPMPIQDAIDLAEFLVHTTIMYSRFSPGPSTVGGPIEIAAITKHEDFRWVKRKHYYEQQFNPERKENP